MSPSPFRVASVGYLNAQPLWNALAGDPGVALEPGLPTEVARRIAEDEADVGLIPVAAAATIGELRVVRGIAIGARGPVRSVVLVSERPLGELTQVALDLSSRTSVVLARLLMRERLGREPKLVGLPAAEAVAFVGGTRGAVVIGDAALAIEGRFPHVLDLGQAWLEWTGLPFVFAAWFGRKGSLSPDAEERLVTAKQDGLGRRDRIADAHAERSGLPAPRS